MLPIIRGHSGHVLTVAMASGLANHAVLQGANPRKIAAAQTTFLLNQCRHHDEMGKFHGSEKGFSDRWPKIYF